MKKTKSKGSPVSKKVIRSKIENSVNRVVGTFKIDRASKKVKKEIQKASRKIASKVSDVLRKTSKRTLKGKLAKNLNGQKPKTKAVA